MQTNFVLFGWFFSITQKPTYMRGLFMAKRVIGQYVNQAIHTCWAHPDSDCVLIVDKQATCFRIKQTYRHSVFRIQNAKNRKKVKTKKNQRRKRTKRRKKRQLVLTIRYPIDFYNANIYSNSIYRSTVKRKRINKYKSYHSLDVVLIKETEFNFRKCVCEVNSAHLMRAGYSWRARCNLFK